MNDKVLDLVQKFINLSTSPEEEEARTSALLACRLIHKHGLVVGHPTTFKVAAKPPPSTAWKPSTYAPRPAPKPKPTPSPSKHPRPKIIDLVYKAKCQTCGRAMFRGERAWYRPHCGVAHYTCSYDSLY